MRSPGRRPDAAMPSKVPPPWAPAISPRAEAPSSGRLLASTGRAICSGPITSKATAAQ